MLVAFTELFSWDMDDVTHEETMEMHCKITGRKRSSQSYNKLLS